jgi:hypothetical protein
MVNAPCAGYAPEVTEMRKSSCLMTMREKQEKTDDKVCSLRSAGGEAR